MAEVAWKVDTTLCAIIIFYKKK